MQYWVSDSQFVMKEDEDKTEFRGAYCIEVLFVLGYHSTVHIQNPAPYPYPLFMTRISTTSYRRNGKSSLA